MDGIIVIDKEKEYTSHDIVRKVKKILNVSKVGHTGTLDPNATGVLPILIGKGTSLSKYLINHDKIYDVTLELGEKRDTADIEGKVVEVRSVDTSTLTPELVKEVLNTFLGEQMQIPPIYSAIKVNGKKLYEYARKGEKVEVAARRICIYDIYLTKIEEKKIYFEVSCSKGTYIRSLCEDIAEKLETVGYMKELRRVKVGEFSLEQAITIKQLEEKAKDGRAAEPVITIEKFYQDKEEVIFSKSQLQQFLNGVKIAIDKEDDIYRIYDEESKFIGLGIIQKHQLKRDVII